MITSTAATNATTDNEPIEEKVVEARRISCHRCGNIRKRRVTCSSDSCPHIYCGRCHEKTLAEYGPIAFESGCPVCKGLCCCSAKTKLCTRANHCYRKCPASKQSHKPDIETNKVSVPVYAACEENRCSEDGYCQQVKRKVENSIDAADEVNKRVKLQIEHERVKNENSGVVIDNLQRMSTFLITTPTVVLTNPLFPNNTILNYGAQFVHPNNIPTYYHSQITPQTPVSQLTHHTSNVTVHPQEILRQLAVNYPINQTKKINDKKIEITVDEPNIFIPTVVHGYLPVQTRIVSTSSRANSSNNDPMPTTSVDYTKSSHNVTKSIASSIGQYAPEDHLRNSGSFSWSNVSSVSRDDQAEDDSATSSLSGDDLTTDSGSSSSKSFSSWSHQEQSNLDDDKKSHIENDNHHDDKFSAMNLLAMVSSYNFMIEQNKLLRKRF